MYVKVTAGRRKGNFPKGDFLAKVHPPIYCDRISAKLGGNAKWEASEGSAHGQALVSPGDVDWGEAIGASIDFLHLLELDADSSAYEQGKPRDTISVRYVWWIDPDTGLTAVVTTRNIFILGDNGKTIDRV